MKLARLVSAMFIVFGLAPAQTIDLGQNVFFNNEGEIVVCVDAALAVRTMDSPYVMFMVYMGSKAQSSISVHRDDVVMVYKGQEIQMPSLDEWRKEYRNANHDFVAGPLGRIDFVPDTVLVYGNPAQVLRLLNACLFEKGGALRSEFSGRGDCTDIVIRTLRTNEPQLILPCYGDRIFGMAADDEMAFTFPFAMAEKVVAGLEGTHAGGVRHPMLVYLRSQAEYPKSYQELARLWAEEKKRT